MNYEIVKIQEHSGNKATLYSIVLEDGKQTLYEQFLNENKETHRQELISITNRLSVIGQKTGARANFFKHDEGKPGDGVCALYDDPEYKLRLYCIRFANVAIILGGGGPKTKETKAWQDDKKLKISDIIKKRPALGIRARDASLVVNKRLKVDVSADLPILTEHLLK